MPAKKAPAGPSPAVSSRSLVSRLPSSWVPYAELMRLHKPSGFYAFYYPHLAGLLFARVVQREAASSLKEQVIAHLCILVGTVLLRGAACTWNDVLDAEYDRQVARCRSRPIARGAVTERQGVIFTIALTVLGIALTLRPLPSASWAPAALFTATQVVYPLFKRFSNYPQVWLGFSFALGVLVGAGAGGVDVGSAMAAFFLGNSSTSIDTINFDISGLFSPDVDLRTNPATIGACLTFLYLAVALNVFIYDTIYGHQDLKDDIKAGVKSVAVAWQDSTKRNSTFFTLLELALLAKAGHEAQLGLGYAGLAVGGTAAVMAIMLHRVRLDVPEDCMSCFTNMIHGTGLAMAAGMVAAS